MLENPTYEKNVWNEIGYDINGNITTNNKSHGHLNVLNVFFKASIATPLYPPEYSMHIFTARLASSITSNDILSVFTDKGVTVNAFKSGTKGDFTYSLFVVDNASSVTGAISDLQGVVRVRGIRN